MRARAPALCSLTVIAVLPLGCAPERGTEPEQLETVEVDAGATAAMTPEGDAVEQVHGSTLAGSLPSSFPAGLPVYPAASVSEFSDPDDEVRFVILSTPDDVATTRSRYAALLDQSGWRAAGDRWSRERDGQRVQVTISSAPVSGSLIRIDY